MKIRKAKKRAFRLVDPANIPPVFIKSLSWYLDKCKRTFQNKSDYVVAIAISGKDGVIFFEPWFRQITKE